MKFVRTPLLVVLSLWSFLAVPVQVCSEEVGFEVTIEADNVELGSTVELTLIFNGTAAAPPVQLPKIEGLETRYIGPSTQIAILNGQMSRSVAVTFMVIPLKTGTFQIPSITVTLNGKDYTSQPVDLQVTDPGSGRPLGQGQNSSVGGLQDKVFIVMSTPKKEAYLNEPIPLTIKLYVSDIAVKSLQYPVLDHDGFSADNFSEPERYRQAIGGLDHQVVAFKTFVYPSRAGDLTLGPAKLIANILFKRSGRRADPFDRFESIFGEDFGGFFDSLDVTPVTLESPDLGIRVLPLPEEGKPEDFSGAVGTYDFTASVSPTEVKAGDPLTVKMQVAGHGNLKAVTMPAFKDLKNFKVYDPQISERDGVKFSEQVVIPTSDTIRELPAVRFSYFDAEHKKYETVTRGPFPLAVAPGLKADEAKVVGLSPVVPEDEPREEPLGRDIRFIKDGMGTLRKRGAACYRTPGFLGLAGVFLAIWSGLFLYHQVAHHLKKDPRLARRLQAPYKARKGLLEARHFMAQGREKEFYDALFKVLQDYFSGKFHLPAGTITGSVIAGLLRQKGINGAVLKNIETVFAECELVRFASAQAGPEKMPVSFRLGEEIIDYLERNYR